MSNKNEDRISTFEEGLQKLETIVSEMEESKLPLDKLITHYEAGSKLLAQCDLKLKEAEKKIEILKSAGGSEARFETLDSGQ